MGGSDHHIPCIQAGYERALNYTLPILARPDLLVAPGLLGGSTIFSPEQLIIDVEVIRRCKRLMPGNWQQLTEKWLGEVIATIGSGGNYLTHSSTRRIVRSGEIYFSKLGLHGSLRPMGRFRLARLAGGDPPGYSGIDLATKQPLPLPESAETRVGISGKTGSLPMNRK